ncbi:MAG: PAS domain-containing protein [Magnetococcales bacterium]|nr:PAS domain-containing protein [Magnetococcales bacterium]
MTADQILDQMATGIIVLNQHGCVHQINSAAERLLGKPGRHLAGLPLHRILPGYPVAIELVEQAQRHAMPFRARSTRINPAPNRSMPVSLTASPLRDELGQLMGILLEIDELGHTERLAQGSQLNETLDCFGNMALAVAHEVKNPLAGIRGIAQLLELEAGDGVSDYTTLIRTEVDRIAGLLDRLLGLADQKPMVTGELNIHEILDHVLRIRAVARPEPRRDYDPSLPSIRGDRDQLIQLFLNLLHNGLEAAGEEGSVTIQTRIAHHNSCLSGQGRRYQHLLVAISDNGPGISDTMQQQIFLPFVTSKEKGTGLGLAIAQKIVQQHNGWIELDSCPGATVFRVLLPISNG